MAPRQPTLPISALGPAGAGGIKSSDALAAGNNPDAFRSVVRKRSEFLLRLLKGSLSLDVEKHQPLVAAGMFVKHTCVPPETASVKVVQYKAVNMHAHRHPYMHLRVQAHTSMSSKCSF